MTRHLLLLTAAGLCSAPFAYAANLPPSTVPGSPPGFNYPLSYDSTTADPKNHKIIYQDKHVRTLEVTLWPNDKEVMHGHAYPSFFANDEVQPKMKNVSLDAYGRGMPPFGFEKVVDGAPLFPHCMTLGPQNPHAATITDTFPQHFYRMEFKRLDPLGYRANWQTYYPEFTGPAPVQPAVDVSGPKLTADWPYPINYETVRAAPGNFIQRFDNGHVRIMEVIVRPGETTPMFGSPYFAVEGFDNPPPGSPSGVAISERQLDPQSPLLAHFILGVSDKPKGLDGPVCRVTGPMPPRQITNTDTIPLHYYRVEFLRMDGDAFRDNWKQWYPEMAEGPKPADLR